MGPRLNQSKKWLMERVAITNGGCWEWQRCRTPHGYGDAQVGGKHVRAHRAAWDIFRGAIPLGMCVLHKCDNPPCCNPKHLFLGTQRDNMRDMNAKGNLVIPNLRGEDLANSKLTDDLVRMIRSSKKSTRKLSEELHMSYQNVWLVRKRITWRHVV